MTISSRKNGPFKPQIKANLGAYSPAYLILPRVSNAPTLKKESIFQPIVCNGNSYRTGKIDPPLREEHNSCIDIEKYLQEKYSNGVFDINPVSRIK